MTKLPRSTLLRHLELLYHVTPDDSVIGPIERHRAHAAGILHRSGMIFVVRSDGLVLIQRRSPARETFPDCYDASCSFHVRFGESYEGAAKRELMEEVGLATPLVYLGKFAHYNPPENEMVAVFTCTSDDQPQISKEEFSNAKFCSKAEIDKIVEQSAPWLKIGWKIAREKI